MNQKKEIEKFGVIQGEKRDHHMRMKLKEINEETRPTELDGRMEERSAEWWFNHKILVTT